MAKRIQPHLMCGIGDIASYVLIPGDPGRVPLIAAKLDWSRKVSENRGYVAYTGAVEGVPVSAVSSGIGCPSAAIAVEELARIGARVLIRVGTTGSISPDIDIGDIVIATAATRTDGATRAYVPPEFPAVADFDVTWALTEAAQTLDLKPHLGVVWTSDAFYAESGELLETWRRAGVLSVEMECSAIFTLARLLGLKAGAILAVDGNLVKGTKKGEFEPGEARGELDERVRRAIDAEIEAAIRAVKIYHHRYGSANTK